MSQLINTLKSLACASAVTCSLATSAIAAPVTFGGPISIGPGTSSLNQAGNVVAGFNAGPQDTASSQSPAITDDRPGNQSIPNFINAGGVPFFAINSNQGSLINASVTATSGRSNDPDVPINTGDANFNTVLNSAAYSLHPTFNGNTSFDLTLSNLTSGQFYTVQLFAVRDVLVDGFYDAAAGNPPGGTGANTLTYSSAGGANSATIRYTDNVYIIGSFIADATTQTITLTGHNIAVLSALVVRTVPEIDKSKSLVPFALLGLVFLGLHDRRRRMARPPL